MMMMMTEYSIPFCRITWFWSFVALNLSRYPACLFIPTFFCHLGFFSSLLFAFLPFFHFFRPKILVWGPSCLCVHSSFFVFFLFVFLSCQLWWLPVWECSKSKILSIIQQLNPSTSRPRSSSSSSIIISIIITSIIIISGWAFKLWGWRWQRWRCMVMMIMITTIIMVMMVLSKLKLIGLAAKPAGNCICIRICICLCICISVCICILVLYNVQTMSLLLAAWRPSTVVPPSWAHPSLIYFFSYLILSYLFFLSTFFQNNYTYFLGRAYAPTSCFIAAFSWATPNCHFIKETKWQFSSIFQAILVQKYTSLFNISGVDLNGKFWCREFLSVFNFFYSIVWFATQFIDNHCWIKMSHLSKFDPRLFEPDWGTNG